MQWLGKTLNYLIRCIGQNNYYWELIYTINDFYFTTEKYKYIGQMDRPRSVINRLSDVSMNELSVVMIADYLFQ